MKKKLVDYEDNLVFGIIRNNILNGKLEYKKAKVLVIGSEIDFKKEINTDPYIIKVDVAGFDEELIKEAVVKMSKSSFIEGDGFSFSASISSVWCKEESWLEINISHFLFYTIFEFNL